MANSVELISDALESAVSAILPTYKKLDYAYFPEKNQFYGNTKRYGVTVDAGASTPTITKAITIDQVFNVILTNDYAAHDDETDLSAQVFILHDALELVYLDIFNKKLGLTNLVYFVGPISFTAPLIDQEQQIIILTMAVNIQYRNLLI